MELWDLYDSDEKKTGEVFERTHNSSLNIPNGRYHLVCDILVKHTDGTYLLCRRDLNKDSYPGFWEASAGGAAQLGEEPLACAERELFEETGLHAEKFELLNKSFNERSHSIVYSYITEVSCPKDAIVLQKGETIDYKWVDAKGLIEHSESDLAVSTAVARYQDFYDQLRQQIACQ